MTTPFSDRETGQAGRISPRHVFEATIRIRLERDGRKLSLPGWARNLSETGLGGFVAEPLTLGEIVVLEIPLAESTHEAIPAKVVRVLGTEFGFQFTALSPEQRRQIRAKLEQGPAISYHDGRP
ncbi:MAG: PilZ domain-containing protein [Terriglobales bacterium]